MGITLSAYASDYPRLYHNDEDELRACLGEAARERGGGLGTADPSNPVYHWWPSTVDFKEEAMRHGQLVVGVSSFSALLTAIRSKKNIDEVLWFGHGSAHELQFGKSTFKTSDLAGLVNTSVRASFNPAGKITFTACNVAQDEGFLQSIASKLRVTVHGFNTGVEWGLKFSGNAPHRKIIERGIRSLPKPVEKLPK
jgi:hypothetical protein